MVSSLSLLLFSFPSHSLSTGFTLSLSPFHFCFVYLLSRSFLLSFQVFTLFLFCFSLCIFLISELFLLFCLPLNILILLTPFSFCFSLQFNSIYYTISLLCPPLHVPFSHFFLSLLIALNSLHFSLDPLSTYLPR